MHGPSRDVIVRRPGGDVWLSDTLVLGPTLSVSEHNPSGLPELGAGGPGEAVLLPSGGDDAPAIQAALDAHARVRLAPEVFTLRQPLTLPHATVLAGSGSFATELRVEHGGSGIVVHPAASGAGVEGLTLTGPGAGATAASGVLSTRAAGSPVRGLAVRDVAVTDFGGDGVRVAATDGVELWAVAVRRVGQNGVTLLSCGAGALLGRVAVEDAGVRGVAAEQVTGLVCIGLTVVRPGFIGVYLERGGGHRLTSVRVTGNDCSGVELVNVSGAALDDVETRGCFGGLELENSRDVSVASLRDVGGTNAALAVDGGSSVAVAALLSDRSSAGYFNDRPHVVVGGGAKGVIVTSLRRIDHAGGVLTWEADVAAAGGRVVFIQHDLDPAKVNAGGNFAQL